MLNILFRCDAAPDIGFGHVARCLTLAKAFRENYDCKIQFAMRRDDNAISKVQIDFPVLRSTESPGFNYPEWLSECIDKTHSDVLILDVRDGLRSEELDVFKAQGPLIVSIDDPEDKRLAADLIFYPPVPQVQKMDWTNFTGQFFSDWSYVIVSQDLEQKNTNIQKKEKIELLISMGWSDPANLSLLALEALSQINRSIEVTIIIGGGFESRESILSMIESSHHHFVVIDSPDNIYPFLSKAQLAVVSFGVTAYEAVAVGVPTILLCLSDDHAKSATTFSDIGIGINMGKYQDIDLGQLAQNIESTLGNEILLNLMADIASSLKCGEISSITAKIVSLRNSHAK